MKTIATYKTDVTIKKTIKIPMPKYRAGQEILINAKDYDISKDSKEYKNACCPMSMLISRAKFNREYNVWVYTTHLDDLTEEYITNNLIS